MVGAQLFKYGGNAIVSLFSALSRSLGQLSAIRDGVHPSIRVLQILDKAERSAELQRLHFHVLVVAVLLPSMLLACISAYCLRRSSARHELREVRS